MRPEKRDSHRRHRRRRRLRDGVRSGGEKVRTKRITASKESLPTELSPFWKRCKPNNCCMLGGLSRCACKECSAEKAAKYHMLAPSDRRDKFIQPSLRLLAESSTLYIVPFNPLISRIHSHVLSMSLDIGHLNNGLKVQRGRGRGLKD